MMATGAKFPRDLTAEERSLTRWIIQNGDCEATPFLQQLDRAKVCAECQCGCASVDFEIDEVEPDRKQGMELLGDFVYGDASTLCGIFVFACGGRLAGLDVYALAVDEAPRTLPDPSLLRPIKDEYGAVEKEPH